MELNEFIIKIIFAISLLWNTSIILMRFLDSYSIELRKNAEIEKLKIENNKLKESIVDFVQKSYNKQRKK